MTETKQGELFSLNVCVSMHAIVKNDVASTNTPPPCFCFITYSFFLSLILLLPSSFLAFKLLSSVSAFFVSVFSVFSKFSILFATSFLLKSGQYPALINKI